MSALPKETSSWILARKISGSSVAKSSSRRPLSTARGNFPRQLIALAGNLRGIFRARNNRREFARS